MTRTAWGHALITLTDDATVLDAWFPAPALGEPGGAGELAAPAGLGALAVPDAVRGVRRELRLVSVDLDAAPVDAPGRLAAPAPALLPKAVRAAQHQPRRAQFGLLANVVWTTQGPCAVATASS
jgi:2,3,4,5-tetrahydropyridine-2-carboxylate N-succinyltransferase